VCIDAGVFTLWFFGEESNKRFGDHDSVTPPQVGANHTWRLQGSLHGEKEATIDKRHTYRISTMSFSISIVIVIE
jgi:hypothetical protein